ncbi:CDP-alcohol phosphatidyltransferase family protein [Amorphus coralli]|uniref:CDP-alcohol phosphatidyltransferase family protein n=1 Tax=Amorphus coralli TaxID=340680 RepID=UPI00036F14B5
MHKYSSEGVVRIVTIPNLLTVLRFLLVPVVVWAIIERYDDVAFAVFIVAGLTDGLDGFIAKKWNLSSRLGAYLDPLADKALLVSIFVSLGIVGQIPIWLVAAVVARDVLILAAVVVSSLLGQTVPIRPLFVSKINTVAQILLAALVLADLAFPLELARPRAVMVLVVAALTAASAAAYLVVWLRYMSERSMADLPQKDTKP